MSATMTRSPSPSFGSQRKKSYSPQPSPAPFLTPNPFDCPSASQGFSFHSNSSTSSRPLPRRLLSLQSSTPNTSRVSPYSIPSPISPISPISPASPSLPSKPKRPTISHRSHSFCASTSNATYALASAPSSGHLSPDKRVLVAPPLERTLSSIGQKGNTSPPTQQMSRPVGMGMGMVDIENINLQRTPTRNRAGVLTEKDVNYQSPQSPPQIPTIYVHPSLTPPRPSLSTTQTDSSRSSSFASSASTAILTPTTPHDLLFKNDPISEDEENAKHHHDDDDEVEGNNALTQGVDHLMI
ncbi:hypothetical protein I302_102953 [Kwoniella bestiolae CBS 10118]|uniref:Uncharacterized protein n=1 Tax=Kwoniella bestiolae CBS 10118 TaxID=1296100 RepID=A0A1B9GGE2_9TREE|nr:hypothetical protein I302_01649 [Kwoniella bestiolae CBS 10118]OCF30130.1 hypothetical protein I302_01649 [Kwoniella bestiolae CBS 10118]